MSNEDTADGRRAAVFGAIRASLGRNALTPEAQAELDGRIAAHRRNLVPARARGERAELLRRFVEMAEAAACTVAHVPDDKAVPQALSDYLRTHNLPTSVAMAPDAWLGGLDWDGQPLLEIRRGRAENDDLVGVTPAFAGVAETGTLVMASGPEHPSTLNFMPDYHVVVLRASQVVGGYEDAFERLRQANGAGKMPRTVNMITGPSRTGDIELTIHLGAHGPRSLHIVVIDDEEGAADSATG